MSTGLGPYLIYSFSFVVLVFFSIAYIIVIMKCIAIFLIGHAKIIDTQAFCSLVVLTVGGG